MTGQEFSDAVNEFYHVYCSVNFDEMGLSVSYSSEGA